MIAVFAFAVTLLLAVLISDLAERSVLSTAVLFLVAGVLLGPGGLGVATLRPEQTAVGLLSELALFSVLFSDGMKVGIRDLAAAWTLPGRALLLGLPLTLLGTAVLARWVAGLGWAESFLVGAVLSPTDPVFAAAIVGREEVPGRLRHLLNVESGLNDGLALPIVVAMLAVVGKGEFGAWEMLAEVLGGIALGVAIPWAAITLERSRFFSAHASYRPLNAVAIGLLVLSMATMLHVNGFLAAFAAGVTVASVAPDLRAAFHPFGELASELLKLAALMVFGSLISVRFLGEIPMTGYLFVVLVLVAVRPVALYLSLLRSPLDMKERATAAWFGPKGFASVVFGLLILKATQIAPERADAMFHLVALCVAGSILAHSSTDVLAARWLGSGSDTRPDADQAPVLEIPETHS